MPGVSTAGLSLSPDNRSLALAGERKSRLGADMPGLQQQLQTPQLGHFAPRMDFVSGLVRLGYSSDG